MRSHRNFGYVLNDVRRQFVLRFEKRARDFSLTMPQCRVLTTLLRSEGVSQAKLAQLADLEPMTMVRILDHMEREGLIERRVDPRDRRARRLYLAAGAKPLLDRIWRLSDLTRSEAFAGIDRAERDAFIAVLGRIQSNLIAVQDAPIDRSAARALAGTAGRGKRARPRTATISRNS
jgi:DNA-binding MarR family transcriptional regulator